MTDERWEPRVAAQRLAEYHANVLDYVGRVDQAVTTGDLWYLTDKGAALVVATEKLVALAKELRDEQTSIGPHLPLVEDYLVRAGWTGGYRVISALHPERRTEPRGTLDHIAEMVCGRVERLGGNVYGVKVAVAVAHGPADLLITSNEDQDGYLITACSSPALHADAGCVDREFICVEDDEAIRTAVDEALSWLARGPIPSAVTR